MGSMMKNNEGNTMQSYTVYVSKKDRRVKASAANKGYRVVRVQHLPMVTRDVLLQALKAFKADYPLDSHIIEAHRIVTDAVTHVEVLI